MMRRTRLQVEVLEDRTTPSALPGLDIAVVHGPQPVTAAEAGHVIADFAVENQGARLIWGEATIVDGSRIVTWALVSPHDNTILAVGATFSVKMAQEMPEAGPGPAGAFASLEFPALVQETTFFNHLEIQPEPHGHDTAPGSVNPDRNRVPHFDFHFYGIPEEQVWAISNLFPPLPAVPAERLPAGYTQPGPSVLQMGRHSAPVWSLTDPNPLSTVMILGYLPNGSQMHFVEPMISQEVLLSRQDFSLAVPMPQDLGRASPTLYPTRFNALFQGNAYSLAFSDFVTMPVAADAAQAAATGFVAAADPQPATIPVVSDFSALGLLLVEGPGGGTIARAFQGLDIAVQRFIPPNPVRVAPVFALNYGSGSEALPAVRGLQNAAARLIPPNPVRLSPIFFGLLGGTVEELQGDGPLA